MAKEKKDKIERILVVIDMQKDFTYGVLGNNETRKIIPRVREKIQEYVNRGDHVIYTRDTHRKNYLETKEGSYLPIVHCIKWRAGWRIIKELILQDDPVIIDKYNFGVLPKAWRDTLTSMGCVQEEENMIFELVGVCTDICVVTNALILKTEFPEATVRVDGRCCAGTSIENHLAALQVMECCQVEVEDY